MGKKQIYALVKWIEDDTSGYIGIPVEWIKYFDLNKFISGEYDKERSISIECREKNKKEPSGGWPCYDGLIIDVSSKLKKIIR